MRSRPAARTAHQEAVARRLAELSAQLAVADEPGASGESGAGSTDWWAGHTRPSSSDHDVDLGADLDSDLDAGPLKDPRDDPDAAHPGGGAGGLTTLREPGRHASRRPLLPGWGDLVPRTLRGRVAVGASHVAVLAVLVAIGLAATSWWVVRGDAGAAEVVVPVAAGTSVSVAPTEESPTADEPGVPGATEEGVSGAASGPASSDEVVVDVAGKVRRPGVLHLPAGSRVVDAIEEAGGARPRVDLSSLNLARVLVDGEQVLVGEPAAAAAPTPSGAAAVPGAPPALVDLNLADQALLETLPGVGPVTATSILTWREQNGAFTSVHELLEVDGIGDVTLARLEPLVTV